MINRFAMAGLAASLLTGCTQTPPMTLDPNAESLALAGHIEDEYGDYLREYIHFYLAYGICKYSFVDDDVLNALADDALKEMTSRAAKLIRAEHGGKPGGLSKQAIQYAARLAVLTSVEMWSNVVTAEIKPSYQVGDFDCASTAAEYQKRYESLQEFELPE